MRKKTRSNRNIVLQKNTENSKEGAIKQQKGPNVNDKRKNLYIQNQEKTD